jgi:phosphatidylglycerophosphate synthase
VFDHFFRVLKDRLLAPVALWLGRWCSPNAVTVVACLLGVTCGWEASERRYGQALVLWLLNRTADGLDGSVARAANRQTDFGGYLDIVLDFVVYAAVPVGLVRGDPTAPNAQALIALLAAFFVNAASWMYLSALLEKQAAGARVTGERTSITMPPALVAGTETIIFYSAFLLFPSRLTWLMTAMALLVSLNVVQRLAWARRRLST